MAIFRPPPRIQLPAKLAVAIVSPPVVATTVFRKTLSALGTRTGTRQGN